MTNPLSPAAQAVLDAIDGIERPQWIAEAALRAAAVYCTRERRVLMTIADELEGVHD